MTKPIILSTANAFRANPGEATEAAKPVFRDDDHAAPIPGAFTRQELRDLVLHWMG